LSFFALQVQLQFRTMKSYHFFGVKVVRNLAVIAVYVFEPHRSDSGTVSARESNPEDDQVSESEQVQVVVTSKKVAVL